MKLDNITKLTSEQTNARSRHRLCCTPVAFCFNSFVFSVRDKGCWHADPIATHPPPKPPSLPSPFNFHLLTCHHYSPSPAFLPPSFPRPLSIPPCLSSSIPPSFPCPSILPSFLPLLPYPPLPCPSFFPLPFLSFPPSFFVLPSLSPSPSLLSRYFRGFRGRLMGGMWRLNKAIWCWYKFFLWRRPETEATCISTVGPFRHVFFYGKFLIG